MKGALRENAFFYVKNELGELQMQYLTNLFLNRRGYTPEYLTQINDPRHPDLMNLNKLCGILKTVHDSKARIVIMPDFDTDGISAATVGFAGMAQMGFNVALYAPLPAHGYGIRVSDIQNVINSWPDVKYIITCDVGITCYDAFEYANKKGLHVLVTDHHDELKEKPKPLICDVIVNPCQLNETYPLKGICGAHVFYQVLVRYSQMYTDNITQNLINALNVFAGIGTIGDMMPLLKENRQLVKDTVRMLHYLYENDDLAESFPPQAVLTYRRAFIGLKILLQQFHRHGKLLSEDALDEKWLGWTLVPTYNSAKRLSLSMTKVFSIFFNANSQVQADCSDYLIEANDTRKRKTREYMDEIVNQIENKQQPWYPFAYVTEASGGFAGLIANQLMQKTGMPTFVFNKDTLSGSGRSPEFFPIIMGNGENIFDRYGIHEFNINGHPTAFGINFKDINQINRFYDYFIKLFLPIIEKEQKKIQEAQAQGTGSNADLLLSSRGIDRRNDAFIDLNNDMGFYKDTNMLKPFGQDFAEPLIEIEFNPQASQIYTMGKEKQHLKIITPEGLQMISWNSADLKNDLLNKSDVHFSGNFSVNKFRGRENLQMIGDVLQ